MLVRHGLIKLLVIPVPSQFSLVSGPFSSECGSSGFGSQDGDRGGGYHADSQEGGTGQDARALSLRSGEGAVAPGH